VLLVRFGEWVCVWCFVVFFFFNDTATTEIYTLSLHDALPIYRVLREMRSAIDKYKDAADAGIIAPTDLKVGTENYPPDLETLVNGVTKNNDATGVKLKFLRRIPMDPITRSTDWGLRSYSDKPDSTAWGGSNVFDVYSKAEGKGLDGTKYKDW